MAHVKAEDSAKLAYLEELLDEVVAGEHRALLFCRSTRMHQILERFLNEWGIKFLQLTGDTPTDLRQRLVVCAHHNHPCMPEKPPDGDQRSRPKGGVS